MVRDSRYDALFIGGEWVHPDSGQVLEVVSPYSEEVIAKVPSSSTTDADKAVTAARRAFDSGPWPRTDLAERIAVMTRFSELLHGAREEIATTVTEEMGCPISVSRVIQAAVPAAILDANIELAAQYPFRSVRRSATGNALVARTPVGVVAAVVPWNMPLASTMQKLAPALLSGCAMVLKPSPETPLSAYLLAELLTEAGLPEGVINVVPADREVSEYLVAHPAIDKVAFTGSTAVGRRIASICGDKLRPVTLELGGKSAAIFLDDADLPTAVETLRMGAFRNSGQTCSLKTRLVVSKRREADLLDLLGDLVRAMPVGDPMNEATQIGPMVSDRQQKRVQNYLKIGRDEGAEIAIGGGARPVGLDHGYFVEPTVFRAVRPEMRIAQEEIFGPVLAVLTYEDEEEAVAIANDSAYGLNGAVYSADPEKALAIAARIDTGTVEINGSPAGFHAPMGGMKDSGMGREAGPEGFDPYIELRSYGLPSDFAENLSSK